jgi:hypothetical protein
VSKSPKSFLERAFPQQRKSFVVFIEAEKHTTYGALVAYRDEVYTREVKRQYKKRIAKKILSRYSCRRKGVLFREYEEINSRLVAYLSADWIREKLQQPSFTRMILPIQEA